METPGTALAAFCSRERISQEKLAERCAVLPATVSKWISDKQRISTDVLPTVVRVTGIPARVLRPDLAVLILPPWLQRRHKIGARAA